MKELVDFIAYVCAAGVYPVQLSDITFINLANKVDSVDKQTVPPGEYITLNVHVFIPAARKCWSEEK